MMSNSTSTLSGVNIDTSSHTCRQTRQGSGLGLRWALACGSCPGQTLAQARGPGRMLWPAHKTGQTRQALGLWWAQALGP